VKKIVFLYILLVSFKGFSQQPELLANTWYLQNVIISGGDNFAPVNEEITEVTLDFFYQGSDFQTAVCNGLYADLSFDNNNSNFTLSTTGQTLIVCGILENAIYENLYFGFYYDNQTNPFTYSIATNSDSSTLIVTAANGDQAIYGSARLHVNEFKLSEIKTYPNPVVSELVIEKQNTIENLKVNIYNIIGQLMHSKTVNKEQTAIDVKELKSGVYFFVFEDDNYKKEIRKIIKQ
jgi:hypothetical protein